MKTWVILFFNVALTSFYCDAGGLPNKLDPTDPICQDLAQKSLNKYAETIGNFTKIDLIKVVDATIQFLEGNFFTIDFNAQLTNTKLELFDTTCHATIYQMALHNKTIIDVTCSDAGADPDDPKYRQLAGKALRKYAKTIKGYKYEVFNVTGVALEVFEGLITKLNFTGGHKDTFGTEQYNCFSEILEQPGSKRKKNNVNCHSLYIGGIRYKDPSNPIYRNLAEKSLTHYISEVQKHTSIYHVGTVQAVAVQLVAGLLTKIKFTGIPNAKVVTSHLECVSVIYERKWENFKSIKVDCHPAAAPGVQEVEDPKDPKYRKLANDSLQEYIINHGKFTDFKVSKVNHVTFQIVNGFITRINFTASPDPVHSIDVISCYSEIYQMLNGSKEFDVTCFIIPQAPHPGTGGITVQDPNDPKYAALAYKSLQKYDERSGLAAGYKVTKVYNASTQVVAGILTRLAFRSDPPSYGQEVLFCRSDIIEISNTQTIYVYCMPVETIVDPSDIKYRVLAESSLKKYAIDNGYALNAFEVLHVVQVAIKHGLGTNVNIDFTAAPMLAARASVDNLLSCHSKIWVPVNSQLPSDILSVNCVANKDVNYPKRGLRNQYEKLLFV